MGSGIDSNVLFSFVSLPIIGASFYKFFKEQYSSTEPISEKKTDNYSPSFSMRKIREVHRSVVGGDQFKLKEALFRDVDVTNALRIILSGRSKQLMYVQLTGLRILSTLIS